MKFNLFTNDLDYDQYIIATYFIETDKNLSWAAQQLSYGQSVSNPNMRCKYETEQMFEKHSCRVLHNEEELIQKQVGYIDVAFPICNWYYAEDGISQLLCMLMGGQSDIKGINKCQLTNIDFPEWLEAKFLGPYFGVDGIRAYTNQYNKPLLGGIIKPKIGFDANTLGDMVRELIDGGVDFIKEDEITSGQSCCSLEERLKVVVPLIQKSKVIYCFSITSDFPHLLDRAKLVYNEGGNGIHFNVWNGIGAYKSVRDLDLPLFTHFQTSGNKSITDPSGAYSISWPVICKLVAMSGVDFCHVGMLFGYGNYDEELTMRASDCLLRYRCMPTFSCGLTAGMINTMRSKLNNDWMANAGGSIQSHPNGPTAGAKAVRQAIDQTGGPEYDTAIETWGLY